MTKKLEQWLRVGPHSRAGAIELWDRFQSELRSMRTEEMDRAFFATAHGMLYQPLDLGDAVGSRA